MGLLSSHSNLSKCTSAPPVPAPHSAYLKYTASPLEEVNLDLGRLVRVGAKRKRFGAQKCCVNTGSERLIFYYL